MRTLLAALVAATLLLSTATQAKNFRYASAFEPGTMDPHAFASLYNTRVLNQIYDVLVARDEDFKLEPGLALSWSTVQPTVWRFKLRPNVKFHDGTRFSADDVVFSVERALSKTSAVKNNVPNVTGAKKIDDSTVDIITSVPTPVLPAALTNLRIASKDWMTKHKAEIPQDFNAKEETFAARNANGTGPYMLKEWIPDNRTVLVNNPYYWGKRGNVTQATYTVLSSAASRLAALVSGEVDLVIDPAVQDVDRLKQTPQVKVVVGNSRATQFLGFDQQRDKLLYGEAPGGKNPFKDKRVREAVRHAIDLEALQRKVMRDLSANGRALYTPALDGYDPKFNKLAPYDVERAKVLLKEAGYPNGFSVTLHCSNSQPADSICQGIAGMLARAGIKVSYQPVPFNLFVPKLIAKDVSMYSVGWTPATDAEGALVPLAHTPGKGGIGDYNAGNYSNPKADALIDSARVELDQPKRLKMLVDAMTEIDNDVGFVPIHYRHIFWASRANIRVKPRPNDVLELRFVNVD
jgi:peptide/nickel transport system substrate-binding protein